MIISIKLTDFGIYFFYPIIYIFFIFSKFCIAWVYRSVILLFFTYIYMISLTEFNVYYVCTGLGGGFVIILGMGSYLIIIFVYLDYDVS